LKFTRTNKHALDGGWIALLLVLFTLSMPGCAADPREDYLDSVQAGFATLAAALKDFEPGMVEEVSQMEGLREESVDVEVVVPRSKPIADALRDLNKTLSSAPLPVFQAGMTGFDVWAERARKVVIAGKESVGPGLLRAIEGFTADPDAYKGNIVMQNDQLLFISSRELQAYWGPISTPDGFGISPKFLVDFDVDAWIEGMRERTREFGQR
jgi:hypothetical protein